MTNAQLTKKQQKQLSIALHILYELEDKTQYKEKYISQAINRLQKAL